MSQPYNPYPGQQPPQQPKRRKKWPWIALGVAGVLLIGAGIGASGDDTESDSATTGGGSEATTQQAPAEPAADGKIVYRVSGIGDAGSISYGASDGISQKTNATLPWEHTEPHDGGYDYFTLTAQNGNTDGEISCKITVDGEVIKENTSSGPYAVVNCSGNTGF